MKIDFAKVGESGYKLHPVQREILEFIIEEEEASPSSYAEAHGLKLGNVSYHFKALRERHWLVISDEIPRRGAMEHVHVLDGDAPVMEEEVPA